jgi:hypothetical protein
MSALLGGRPYVFVTGKGGVGKTTVSAALGLAGAAGGRRTVVCEVGDQRRLPALFGVPPGATGEEVRLDGDLWTVSIDPNSALREWLGRQLGSRALVQALTRSNLFQYFVAAAPGARELVTATKLWELGQARRWDRRAQPFDLVVADLPASGHGIGLLRAARTFADIARVGPIASQAGRVASAIEDPLRTALVAVSLAGELPVTETLELEARATADLRRGLDAIVANALLPRRWSAQDLARLEAVDGAVALPARRAARSEAGRARVQRSQLRRLRRHARAGVVTLPFVATATMRPADVHGLADVLRRKL